LTNIIRIAILTIWLNQLVKFSGQEMNKKEIIMKKNKISPSSPPSSSPSSPQRILHAALKEFATHGREGARMARIAMQAKVNKALLFYYFSSKENLFQEVMRQALSIVVPQLQQALSKAQKPKDLLELLPPIYTQFTFQHPDYIRMILLELVREPQVMAQMMAEAFNSYQPSPPLEIKKKLKKWETQGLLKESDPAQLALNLLPPLLFTPIIAPVVEALFQEKFIDSPQFLQQRVASLIKFLKHGALP